jgi:hypothetical protein
MQNILRSYTQYYHTRHSHTEHNDRKMSFSIMILDAYCVSLIILSSMLSVSSKPIMLSVVMLSVLAPPLPFLFIFFQELYQQKVKLPIIAIILICVQFTQATVLLKIHNCQWKSISCKQNAGWQHLSQLKACAFFCLKKNMSC